MDFHKATVPKLRHWMSWKSIELALQLFYCIPLSKIQKKSTAVLAEIAMKNLPLVSKLWNFRHSSAWLKVCKTCGSKSSVWAFALCTNRVINWTVMVKTRIRTSSKASWLFSVASQSICCTTTTFHIFKAMYCSFSNHQELVKSSSIVVVFAIKSPPATKSPAVGVCSRSNAPSLRREVWNRGSAGENKVSVEIFSKFSPLTCSL